MRIQSITLIVLAALAVTSTAVTAAEPASKPASKIASKIAPKIAWYGTLATGLEEAARSERPILLVAAAPHCLGVPGIW